MIDAIHEAINFPVSPDDQLFVLTQGQLSEIIRSAVHQALQDAQQDQISNVQDVQDLRDEIEALKRELDGLSKAVSEIKSSEPATMSCNIKDLFEAVDELDNLIRSLGTMKAEPKQIDRVETLRVILLGMGGTALTKDVRHRMGLSKSKMSEVVAIAEKQGILSTKPLGRDRRQTVLIIKQKLVPGN